MLTSLTRLACFAAIAGAPAVAQASHAVVSGGAYLGLSFDGAFRPVYGIDVRFGGDVRVVVRLEGHGREYAKLLGGIQGGYLVSGELAFALYSPRRTSDLGFTIGLQGSAALGDPTDFQGSAAVTRRFGDPSRAWEGGLFGFFGASNLPRP